MSRQTFLKGRSVRDAGACIWHGHCYHISRQVTSQGNKLAYTLGNCSKIIAANHTPSSAEITAFSIHFRLDMIVVTNTKVPIVFLENGLDK